MKFFQRAGKWLVILFITLYLALWLFSSPVIKYFAKQWLTEQGLLLADQASITVNPFLTRLTIKNLTLTRLKNQEKVLAINHFTAQLALHQLVFDKIVLQKFVLDDFFIKVVQTPKQLEVAGFVIPQNEPKKEKAQSKETKPFLYRVILPQLMLAKGQVDVFADDQAHTFYIDELAIDNLQADQQSANANLTLKALLDQAKVTLDAGVDYKNNTTTINSSFALRQYSLNKIKNHLVKRIKQISQLTGKVSFKNKQTLVINNSTLNLSVEKAEFIPENITANITQADKNYTLKVARLQAALANFKLMLPLTKQAQATTKFSFKYFKLRTLKAITFIDHNLKPVLQRTLFIDKMRLGALDNEKGEQITPFNLSARSNEYAKIELNGEFKPFSKMPSYFIKGHITEFSLPSISSYLKEALQISLQSGQLNTEIDATLIKDKISGNVDIMIKGLETATAENSEVNLLKENATIPLNVALSLLKDSNGNVELNIPLSGSTTDPKFGVSSFFTLIAKKAAMSAAQDYLIKTFVPYANVVSVALSAGDFILKTRFEDFNYQAKQIKPSKEQQQYLQQFIALLNDKPDINVKLCAISVPADLGLENGTNITDKALILKLKKIATQREYAFKNYVLSHSKIDSSRLLLCAANIDMDKKAKPKIKLSV